MNIHSTGKDTFFVELSKKDMQELDITYEEMDYSKIETRRVIWTIIEKARDNLGRDIDPSGNLIIEAASDSSGGCILNFTVVRRKRRAEDRQPPRLTKTAGGIIYEFENADNLLDLISRIRKPGRLTKAVLFSKDEKFRLLVEKLPGEEERRLLEEYAEPLGNDSLTVAHTLEYWRKSGRLRRF